MIFSWHISISYCILEFFKDLNLVGLLEIRGLVIILEQIEEYRIVPLHVLEQVLHVLVVQTLLLIHSKCGHFVKYKIELLDVKNEIWVLVSFQVNELLLDRERHVRIWKQDVLVEKDPTVELFVYVVPFRQTHLFILAIAVRLFQVVSLKACQPHFLTANEHAVLMS